MSKRIPKLLIIDILNCIERIQDYTTDVSYEDFQRNSLIQDAVLRNIQVIGEAANRLPVDFKSKHNEIEWNKIIRTRHIVTHDYDAIDYSILWRIISVHLPSNKQQLELILQSL